MRAPLSLGLLPLAIVCAMPLAQAARDFDGTTGYGSVAATPVTAAAFTLTAWCAPDTISGTDTVIGVFDTAGTDFVAINLSSGNPRLTTVQTTAINPTADILMPTAVWASLSAVEASSTSRSVQVNGAFQGTNATSKTPASLDTVAIGAQKLIATTNFFDGKIGRAAIYSSALSVTDLRSIAYGVRESRIDRAHLVASWRIRGQGTTIPAFFGGGTYDLAITGTAPAFAQPPYRGICGRRPVTPAIWLDASDVDTTGTSTDAAAVSAWANKGSAGGTFSQGTGGNQPLWKRSAAHNGRPAVLFDGTDDYLDFGSAPLTGTSGEVWIVFETAATMSAADHTLLAESDTATATNYVQVLARQAGNNQPCVEQVNADTADRVRVGVASPGTTGQTYLLRYQSTGTAYKVFVVTDTASTVVVTGADSGDWFGDCAGLDNLTLGVLKHTSVVNGSNVYVHEVLMFDGANLTSAEAWDFGMTLGVKWFVGN